MRMTSEATTVSSCHGDVAQLQDPARIREEQGIELKEIEQREGRGAREREALEAQGVWGGRRSRR